MDSSRNDPQRLRDLLDQAGIQHNPAARTIETSARMMRYYLAEKGTPQWREAPYTTVLAIERLAWKARTLEGWFSGLSDEERARVCLRDVWDAARAWPGEEVAQ